MIHKYTLNSDTSIVREAIQFTGDNQDEIETFVGDGTIIDKSTIPIGDLIVKFASKSFIIYRYQTFNDNHTKIIPDTNTNNINKYGKY